MIRNSGVNESFCGIASKLKQTSPDDRRRPGLRNRLKAYGEQLVMYDLVEVSKSFFSYQPILKALQAKDSVPLSDELIGTKATAMVSTEKPDYLPNRIFLPDDERFRKLECFLDNWSTKSNQRIVENTPLDASQAEALRHAMTSRVALLQGPPGTGEACVTVVCVFVCLPLILYPFLILNR